MLVTPWRIHLFGGLSARQGERYVTRFATAKTGALLAYLALFPRRHHAREELVGLFWPEADIDAGRNSLKQSLASLRRQLEPPGTPAGSVLTADRTHISLNSAAVETDVAHFEAALRGADRAPATCERRALLTQALDLYAGDLLPGIYDDWALDERERLAARADQAREALAALPHGAARETARDTAALSDGPAPGSPTPVARLPLAWTRFFGREEEQAHILRLLKDPSARLVTLTGAGGAGKTRLAIECARHAAASTADVAFVPLADFSDAALIADAILGALGTQAPAGPPPLEQVVAALAARPALLVLDNLEQFGEGVAPVVLTLLTRLPGLHILVTSRHRLHVAGEHELHLLPLPTPELDECDLPPERLCTFPGVALFVDRAQLARPDFQITARNAGAVVALCRALTGLPLAIELAAAWAQSLTPAQMGARLAECRDALLVSRRKDVEERHQTLDAAIGWSYGLLAPDLQSFWARLSVFRGGWTAEAAEDVGEEPQALRFLAELRARSLVLAEDAENGMRYRMLEPLREFAWAQLSEAEHRKLAGRHTDHLLRMAEEAAPHLLGPGQAAWLTRLAAEHENVRAALTWALADDPQSALRLTVALIRYWELRSHLREGREWHERAARRVGEDNRTTERARALNAAGALAFEMADYPSAESLYRESLAIWQEIGESRGVAASLNNLGNVESSREDYSAARAYYERALAANREQDNPAWEAINLNNLGVVAEEQGDYAAARDYGVQALALFEALGNTAGRAMALRNLGVIARRQGDPAAAALFRESVSLEQPLEDRAGLVLSLEGLASLAADRGAPVRAALLWSAARSLRDVLGMKRRPAQADTHDADVAAARAAAPDQFDRAWAQGRALTLEQAVALALQESDAGA